MISRQIVAFLLVFACVILPMETFAQQDANALGITVIGGQYGTIDETHTVDIVVRVSAAGAKVTFVLPAGTGVSFPGGASRISVATDSAGFARSGKLSSAGKGGAFDVDVEAAYEGRTASIKVHETNATVSVKPVKAAHKSRKTLWIAIAGAGAAGAALAALTMGRSSSSSGSTPAVATVTLGSPTIGAPQ